MAPPHDSAAPADVVSFSHLRWRFVFQRPQHLLTRCAREHRVFYFEEPVFDGTAQPEMSVQACGDVKVVVPVLPAGCSSSDVRRLLRQLVTAFFVRESIQRYVAWYYTPMALAFTNHLSPVAIVYDCMDELSAFAHAPTEMKRYEGELLERADVVFTGGYSLYEAKRAMHRNVHAVPSSVDVHHFAQARSIATEPEDQAGIGRPRLGYFGVIDERMDFDLLAGVAAMRSKWQIVMLGPIVKIDPGSLPQVRNIHYLGAKAYSELPHYIAGWDVAVLPFARNEATRFISPTKTPEYLASGKPVVSTSIRDVVRPYGEQGLLRIADVSDAFVLACEAAMAEDAEARQREADRFLSQGSWDSTWKRMWDLIEGELCDQPGRRVSSELGSSQGLCSTI